LLLLMCCVKFVDLHHPWDEADLVMVNHLSDMLLDSVCHYFIEDFYIDLH
jgi:protein gp37